MTDICVTHTLKYETSIQDTNSEFCYNMRVTPLDGNFNREESKDFPFTLVEVETDPVTRFYSSSVMSAEEKDRLTTLLEKDFRIEYFERYNVKAKLEVSGIPPFPSECKFSMDPIFIDRNLPGRGMVYISRSHDYVYGFENCRNIKINSLDIDPSYFMRERPVPVSLLQFYDIALYSIDNTKPIVYHGFFGEPVNKDLYVGSIVGKLI